MFLSPSARFIGVLTEPSASAKTKQATVVIHIIEGNETSASISHLLSPEAEYSPDAATFNADESALLLPGKVRGQAVIHVIPTTEQAGEPMDLSFAAPGEFRKLLPVPDDKMFIALWQSVRATKHASHLSVVNSSTTTERPIQSLTMEPLCVGYDCGVALSPDGRWFLAQTSSQIQICDWRADQLVFEHTESDINYSQPHFTPDGQRFIIQRTPLNQMMVMGGSKRGLREKIPVTFELYDVGTREKMADYEPVTRAEAFTISGDGKTLLYARGTTLYAIGFEAAFGMEPIEIVP